MSNDSLQCAICLNDKMVLPVSLDCNHIFCYLCIKGVLSSPSPTCPLCRKAFSSDALNNPNLINTVQTDEIKWSYEGKEGFWLFDTETDQFIEECYQNGADKCQVSIAGRDYVIDFLNMQQYRVDQNSSRKRKIKRCDMLKPREVKGVAGISKSFIKKANTPKKRHKFNNDHSEDSGPSRKPEKLETSKD